MSTSSPLFPLLRRRAALVAVLVLLLLSAGAAQQAAKRPVNHKDYDSWRTISRQDLSPDGKFLAYAIFPVEGSDGEVVVRDLASGKEVRQPAGEVPPPPAPNPENPEVTPAAPSINLAFTSDSAFLVFTTYPAHDDTVKARKEKKPADQMPKGSMVIVKLADLTSTRVADVRNFQVPSKGGSWLAYSKQPKPGERPAGAGAAPAEKNPPATPPAVKQGGEDDDEAADDEADQQRGGGRGGAGGGGAGARRDEYGTDLILRNLATAAERTFADANDYSLSKDARTLVYTVASRKEEDNGVYTTVPGTDAAPAALLKGKGKYGRVTWDIRQTELAFTSDKDDAAAKVPKLKIYYWDRKAAEAAELISASTPGFRPEFVISSNGALSFSRDGGRLFLGCAPPQPEPKEADPNADPGEEKVAMDLWHWRDDYIQPMQKIRSTQDRNRNYRAVYFLDSKKLVQLADKEMGDLTLPDEGRYAIGTDDRLYRRMQEYDQSYADWYVVDLQTGERKASLKKQGGSRASGLSPDGRYLLFFDDKNWQVMSIPEGTITNLTANRPVRFWNEEDDHPAEAPSYGQAGWTKDNRSVLIYDRYDLWQFSADGQTARNLTAGAGRNQKIQFRVTRLEAEDEEEARGIDPKKPLLLRGENTETFDSGFWRAAAFDTPSQPAAPQRLIAGPRNYRAVAKAKGADVVLMTAQTFNEYPDIQITDTSFRNPRKVTNANPQRAQMLWGAGELVKFTSADGVPLKAALYKPENFDPSKKYPMMVYIYEKLSQNVNNFVRPGPGGSINISYYVSNGYLVLTPDIVYTIGHPGQSALKCVLPAIQAVVDKGYVNEKAVGIQGHSWGGYQIAYMVTQTNRFAAAEAGAPVGNMFSAYNGIRWGPGLPRQFQYERTQSRIGATIWEAPTLFMENSPIFHANRIETPLLILHNDADDAVPWYQGIELFLSLRRLGKEAYLAVYNGEPHGIRKRVNQKDYTTRMAQFFDHKLKGGPMPDWMERGIPYNERDQEKEKLKAAAADK